jgi:hypothetical protein
MPLATLEFQTDTLISIEKSKTGSREALAFPEPYLGLVIRYCYPGGGESTRDGREEKQRTGRAALALRDSRRGEYKEPAAAVSFALGLTMIESVPCHAAPSQKPTGRC